MSEGALLRSAVLAQTRAELLLTMRRGENVLITMVVPVLLLIFFASLGIVRAGTARPVDFLLPGMLSLAVIATGMVSLGIATAYERYYGVLKRLGASPLPRAGLIAAKALSVLVLEVLQVALLVVIAAAAYGFNISNTWVIPQILAGPRASGRWTGLQNFIGNLAGISAPVITGFIVQHTGSFVYAFLLTGLMSVLGAASWFFLLGPLEQVSFRTVNQSSLPN